MFDWITQVIASTGYFGIAALMLLENLFPPIPSEVIMPLAGFVAARGELSLWGVVVSGTLGSLAGAAPWYLLGRWFGEEGLHNVAAHHGRWLTLSTQDVTKAILTFRRHGALAVFFGRLIPAIRTLISAPAGIALMPIPKFIFWTALGSSLWTTLLTLAGFLLESQYERVADYMDPISKAVIIVIVATYLYRLVTYRRFSS